MKVVHLLMLSLVLGSPLLSQGRDLNSENPDKPDRYPRETRMIFYAVLEGLYESGVASPELAKLIPNTETMVDADHLEQVNFIYACPICMPTFDALRLYAARKPFYAQKGTRYNTPAKSPFSNLAE